MLAFIQNIQAWLWSLPFLVFLAGVSLYFTIRLKGLQFRFLPYALRLAFLTKEKNFEKKQGDITNFQALMTSLAAAIGTGNIAGVATALSAGGVGALFWMWVIALLGMSLKYAEALLAVKYRTRNSHGEISGGPMYYLAKGLSYKKLAATFALACLVSSLVTGNLVQINSIADAIESSWDISRLSSGIVTTLITSLVLIGGVKSIGRVTEIFVPFMALFYVFGCLFIVGQHLDQVPQAFVSILKHAFNGQAAFGGFIGATLSHAIQVGFARGIFSNEAGMGSSSIASAAAKTDQAGHQAMIAMTSVFISTLVICTMTGLSIILTGVHGSINPTTELPYNGAPLVMHAFQQLWLGEHIVALGLVLFGYSTILGWAYYGEKCTEYIWGIKSKKFFRMLFVALIIPGALLDLELVWALADICTVLLVIPNLIALIALREDISQETQKFISYTRST